MRYNIVILLFLSSVMSCYANEIASSEGPEFKRISKLMKSDPTVADSLLNVYFFDAYLNSDSDKLYKAYYLHGELNYTRANLYEAAKSYKRSYEIAQLKGDYDFIADIYANIGAVFLAIEDLEQAHYYNNLALNYYTIKNDQRRMADMFYNVGIIHFNTSELDSAIYFLSRSEEMYHSQNDDESLGRVFLMLSYVYYTIGNDKLALDYTNKSLKAATRYNDILAMQSTYFTMGEIYLSKNQPESAREHFLKALSYDNVVNNLAIKSDIYQKLSETYQQLGQEKLSYEYLRQSIAISDSLSKTKQINAIHKINFENLENEKEPKKTSTSYTIWWVVTFVPVASILVYLFVCKLKPKSSPKIKDSEKLKDVQKELFTKTLKVAHQEEILNNIKHIDYSTADNQGVEIKKMLTSIDVQSKGVTWDEFEMLFGEINTDFYTNLSIMYPDLTAQERRICALVSLNLTTKEISTITNKSYRSIEVARYRLRKKLDLEKNQSLISFLSELNSASSN